MLALLMREIAHVWEREREREREERERERECLLARLNIPAAALVTSQKAERREKEKQMYKKHVIFLTVLL